MSLLATEAIPESELLTVDEVAERLRVSPATVYRRVHDATLPALRIGEHGPIRIPVAALKHFLVLTQPPLEGGLSASSAPPGTGFAPAVEVRSARGGENAA